MDIKRFSLFPIDLLQLDLKPNEMRVLVALYSFRDSNADIVWPSLESLAIRAGIKDKTTVSKVTKMLCDRGLLVKKKRGFTGGNQYKLIPLDTDDNHSVETSKLEESSKLGKTTKSNLEETSNSNLEVSSKNKELTNELTNELTTTGVVADERETFAMFADWEPTIPEQIKPQLTALGIKQSDIDQRTIEYRIHHLTSEHDLRTQHNWSRSYLSTLMKFARGNEHVDKRTRPSQGRFNAATSILDSVFGSKTS